MDETIRAIVQWSILLVTIVGYYVTFIHYRWWKLYRPSPMIRHLFVSSIAVDFSATILSVIAVSQMTGNPFPVGVGLALVGLALVISLGVKVYRRVDLHELDRPNVDLEQRVETQNQREDRQFGEERRALEVEHTNGDETENQRNDRLIGDMTRKAESILQERINDADQK